MERTALLIIVAIIFEFSILLQSSLAQDDSELTPDQNEELAADTMPEDEVNPRSEDDDEEEDEEEVVVDDEFYQDVDDEDFRPTEEIPADQSIPFPTDI